ncbi:MAG: diacylglycerol/lipid kinase family protein [Gaiellales bacterium]
MTVVMVVNPASANGRTAQRWPDIARLATDAGLKPEVRLTEAPGHATELTRRALKEGAQVILSVGGDGTVSEVVNGFFDGDHAVAPQAELAVVCRGSGCDFIRTYGIPKNVERAVAVAAGGRVRTIDVGVVEFTGHDGQPGTRRFANIASAGLTGMVAAAANRSQKPLGATAAFAWATVSTFVGYRNSRFRIRIDDRELDRVCNNVIVANGRFFAGGMRILPMAEPDDGLLDVLVWGDVSKADLARTLHRLYRGTHINHPKADISRARRVEVRTDVTLPIEADGEVPGTTPAAFGVQAGALRLRVP